MSGWMNINGNHYEWMDECKGNHYDGMDECKWNHYDGMDECIGNHYEWMDECIKNHYEWMFSAHSLWKLQMEGTRYHVLPTPVFKRRGAEIESDMWGAFPSLLKILQISTPCFIGLTPCWTVIRTGPWFSGRFSQTHVTLLPYYP